MISPEKERRIKEMPLVLVSRDPKRIDGDTFKFLIRCLPGLVAEALSVPGTDGALSPGDITVWKRDFGEDDIHEKDLEIIIWANLYPERQANLDSRQKLILEWVKEIILSGRTGFVWILLQPGSFGEF